MSPVSHGLRWGLITGVALSIFGAIFNMTAAYTIPGVSLLFYVLLFIMMAVALRKFTKGNGSRSYGQGLVIAIPLVIISAVVYSVYFFCWVSFVDPDILDFARSQAETAVAGQDVTAEQAEAQAKGFDTMFSAPVFTLLNFAILTFLGILGSFVVSIFGRKQAAAA